MCPASYISTVLNYRQIDERGIRAVAGALLNRLFLDQPIPEEKFADVVFEDSIQLNCVPPGPIVKLTAAQYVEEFFSTGKLRLGSLRYYGGFDHDEIGDPSEGSFILVGRKPTSTAVVEIAGGFDHYVFCCYTGTPDIECRKRFGYDSEFRIVDPGGFATAIGQSLSVPGFHFASCVYSRHKVLIADVPNDFDFNVISARLLDLVSEAKYFVKPNKFAAQSEFRFIWPAENDIDGTRDIVCPNAIQYCAR